MHTFHIPVLGLSYSIDTPLHVARYGISSVVSIIEDELVEKMRAYHCLKSGESYRAITKNEQDYRALRITAYLNLLHKLVNAQFDIIKRMPFDGNNELIKYFELLPNDNPTKILYNKMISVSDAEDKTLLQQQLRDAIVQGAIDVNIMAKVDNLHYNSIGDALPIEYSDALSALRGFANSSLQSSVVLSAGYNPRLYNYLEEFSDFFPGENGSLKKKVILKVSDFRSAAIQGKLLAKKGVWVSEFRIESGLNCGGHAFATDGLLLGPILEDFKQKKAELANELYDMCNTANETNGRNKFTTQPQQKITVQGGIGTSNEDSFLRNYYHLDGTGWGSPFLLVPEATNVDTETLEQLATATKDDYYLSNASPLGVPFHNFRRSTSEAQKKERINKGRPGSPCYKKFLSSNTEFTSTPICTASRQYQHLKIKQLKEKGLEGGEYAIELNKIVEKDCLCEGLSSSVLLKNNIHISHNLRAVTICPGPNLAYFSGTYKLRDMVDHIYGRKNILNSLRRPNMFINELELYVNYLKSEMDKCKQELSKKQQLFFASFRFNLQKGIDYYKSLLPSLAMETLKYIEEMKADLDKFQDELSSLSIPAVSV